VTLVTGALIVATAIVVHALVTLLQSGRSAQDITVFGGFVVGLLVLIVGLGLLVIRYFRGELNSGDFVEYEWPKKAKIGAVALPIVAGAALIAVFMWRAFDAPPRLSVSGKITLHDRQTLSGISNVFVGVLPTSSHATVTLSDGTYTLSVPKGAKGETYQALAHVPNSNPPQFVIGVVQFDADGRGRFDYTFSGSKR